jgi:hypothetical protein
MSDDLDGTWVERQARRVGVPTDFLYKVGHEPEDWAFVIKIHALVETAVTNIVVRHVSRPELDHELRQMPLSRKLTWAGQMHLLPAEQLDFARALSALRNSVAHNVSAIPAFDIPSAVAKMKPDLSAKLLPGDWQNVKVDLWRLGIYMHSLNVLSECEKADANRAATLAADEDRRFAERIALMSEIQQQEIQRQLLGDDEPRIVRDSLENQMADDDGRER